MMEPRSVSRWISKWNTKVHIYLGLFFMLYLWLFAVSGLLLNHPKWYHGAPERTKLEQPIQVPSAGSKEEKAEDLAKQLGLKGELLLRSIPPPKEGHFNFSVMQPNLLSHVDADLKNGVATINVVRPEVPGAIGNLHTFSGVRPIWREAPSRRDWIMTWIWSIGMDVICVALLLMVFTSLYMWYKLPRKRRLGFVALGLGVVSCSFFIWGLAWMV